MSKCPECGWPARALAEGQRCWRYDPTAKCRRECEEAWSQPIRLSGGAGWSASLWSGSVTPRRAK